MTEHNTMMDLKLPKKAYGPICLKILQEFITYHNLPKDLPFPEMKDQGNVALEKIFTVMLASMGSKAEELLKDADEYFHSIPPSAR